MDPSQQYCLRWNNHHNNMLKVFEELLQNECFTDVTLACEGMSIKCHKVVLAAGSNYFSSLFADNYCQHPIVVLKDIRYAEIKAILEYMYRGEVNILERELSALIKVAELLMVKGLSEDREPPNHKSPPTPTNSHRHHHRHRKNDLPPLNNDLPPLNNDLPLLNNDLPLLNNDSPPLATPQPVRTKAPSHRTSPYPQPIKHVMHPTTLAIPPWPTQAIAAMAHSPILTANRYRLSPHETPVIQHARPAAATRTKNDTPILRTALGHGQADGSLDLTMGSMATLNAITSGTIAANNNSNGPVSDTEKEIHGSDDINTPLIMEKKALSGMNIAGYIGNNQKPEWKRYKQYTPTDVNDAIAAVKKGVSPLRASREFGVPSRTLYDKVKKLGIVTSRHHRRGAFPMNLKVEMVNQEANMNAIPEEDNQAYNLASSGEEHTTESNNGSDEALNMHAHGSGYRHPSEGNSTAPNTESPPSPHSQSFSGSHSGSHDDDENEDKDHVKTDEDNISDIQKQDGQQHTKLINLELSTNIEHD